MFSNISLAQIIIHVSEVRSKRSHRLSISLQRGSHNIQNSYKQISSCALRWASMEKRTHTRYTFKHHL